MLIIDKLGLPIESQGSLDKSQAGLMSSIMKNSARLHALLLTSPDTPAAVEGHELSSVAAKKAMVPEVADCMAKIQFKGEQLVVRHKHGLTVALRQVAE